MGWDWLRIYQVIQAIHTCGASSPCGGCNPSHTWDPSALPQVPWLHPGRESRNSRETEGTGLAMEGLGGWGRHHDPYYPLVSSNMAVWKIPELNGGFNRKIPHK